MMRGTTRGWCMHCKTFDGRGLGLSTARMAGWLKNYRRWSVTEEIGGKRFNEWLDNIMVVRSFSREPCEKECFYTSFFSVSW